LDDFAESFSELFFIQTSAPGVVRLATEYFQPDIAIYEHPERVYTDEEFDIISALLQQN
jgi:hypothetical protein